MTAIDGACADGVVMRAATAADLAAIADLHERENARPANRPRLGEVLAAYPAVVAEAEGTLVGFAFGSRFGPDILELLNILIAAPWRGQRLGEHLLRAFEAQASARGWAGVILVNSLGYPGVPEKRLAGHFYERLGYRACLDTGMSRVFAKALPPHGRGEDQSQSPAPYPSG